MMYLGSNPISVNNTYYDSSIIAPDYSELAFPIQKGQGCIYNKEYYIAKQNIITNEEWTSEHWEKMTISSALSQKYEKPQTGIPASDLESGVIPEVPVQDVQVNGTSILSQGVANVPVASENNYGAVKTYENGGTTINSDGKLILYSARPADIKQGNHNARPIVPANQKNATFYGLASAAGDSTQSASSNSVGTYTEAAKRAICKMIGVPYPHGELIRDYTTTADQTEVIINADESSQPFELIKIKVVVILPATTTGAASNYFADALTLNEINESSDTYKLPTMQSAANGNYFFYEFETYGGYLTFSRAYKGSGYNTTLSGINTYVALKSPKCITGFKLSQYSSTTSLVPSGTRILIYGMRA